MLSVDVMAVTGGSEFLGFLNFLYLLLTGYEQFADWH